MTCLIKLKDHGCIVVFAELRMEFTVYKKTEEVDEYVGKGAKKKKGRTPDPATVSAPDQKAGVAKEKERKGSSSKYVPLYSQDGQAADTVQLPGRHPCTCQATKHALLNNCLSCGKIVCAQEWSGPCLFCGQLVVSRAEQAVLDKKNKKSEQLYKKLAGDSRAQYQAALDNKDRLLEYDANSAKRTQIIDDESDYFNVDSNKWLTPQQRQALQAKKEELHADKHRSRLDRRITFDFAGRRVVEEESGADYDISQDSKLLELFKQDAFSVEAEIARRQEEGVIANPNISRARPLYEERGVTERAERVVRGVGAGRVQDRELLEMSDTGVCLSMHQPWASLLVMGIKQHEGRSWYSAHRGRLWIHAASKVPSQHEIDELQEFYKALNGNTYIQFPVCRTAVMTS